MRRSRTAHETQRRPPPRRHRRDPPAVDAGRYPAKRILGDTVDRHRRHLRRRPRPCRRAPALPPRLRKASGSSAPFTALTNDLWTASFPVDQDSAPGTSPSKPGSTTSTPGSTTSASACASPTPGADQQVPQDIPLALRIGANHLEAAAARAKGADAKKLTAAAVAASARSPTRTSPSTTIPITDDLIALAAKYPDLTFATKYPTELPLWVDRERARFSAWYELFPRSAGPVPGQHGTLRDVEARLPEIAAMGFDILYMPPIHPIGVAYRKGKNNSVTAEPGDVGSPWAIGAAEGGHTAILPELGTLADFDALVASRPRPRHGAGAGHRLPVLARPPLGHGASRLVHPSAPTAPSSTPKIRPRSIRTSIR